jgi:hypothetical protein
MKPYERRAAGAGSDAPYYKLAAWDPRGLCWRDGKHAYPTLGAAKGAAQQAPGRYRISCVAGQKRTDLEPFEVQ